MNATAITITLFEGAMLATQAMQYPVKVAAWDEWAKQYPTLAPRALKLRDQAFKACCKIDGDVIMRERNGTAPPREIVYSGGHVRINWRAPLDPKVHGYGTRVDAGGYIYQVLDHYGQKLASGSFRDDLDGVTAWAKKMAAAKGYPHPSVEIVSTKETSPAYQVRG